MNDTIYLDFECLLINQDVSLNNPTNSHTTNISQHVPSGYSISTLRNQNESSNVKYYRAKVYVQKLCDDLRDIACKIFEDEEAKKFSLSSSQKKQHGNAEKCFICNKFFNNNEDSKYYKSYRKEIYHCFYTGKYAGAAHPSCINNYKIKKEIPVVIHNGSNYDFHLIIKELAKNFREEIQCIPEDTETCKTFSITIMHKRAEKSQYLCKVRFIDRNKVMQGSLDSHVNNLSELNVCNCLNKSEQNIKIKYDNYIYTRCKTCTKRSKQLITSLKDKFPNLYQLSEGNIKKFIILLKKGIYPYEYMDNWNKFEEIELPSIDKFYSNLYLKNITKNEYKHAQNV